MRYTVGTNYPYKFFPCNTITEARKKKSELRKQGIKSSIVCVNDNGNYYILAE